MLGKPMHLDVGYQDGSKVEKRSPVAMGIEV
jgi:hypothetical protein